MKPNNSTDSCCKEPVPVGENLFVLPKVSEDAPPSLIGSQCRACGEVFFPSRICCRRCTEENMETTFLSRTGTLYSFSSINVPPPHFIGEVPYLVGTVELPQGEKIQSLLTGCDFKALEIGMEMELVIEVAGTTTKPFAKLDPGTQVLAWKFRPKRRSQS